MALHQPSVLVLGLGNPILCDDGVGIHVARRVKELVAPDEGIAVEEAGLAGFALLDLLDGYERVVFADAVHLPNTEPGTVVRLPVERFFHASHLVAGHEISLPTALTLGRSMGRVLPRGVLIVGVQVGDDRMIAERCTPAVEESIDLAAQEVLECARKAQPTGP